MRKIFVLSIFVIFASQALAQDLAGKKSWDQMLAAARNEGKVIVSGPPSPELRQSLPKAFKERYGITLEYVGGRSNETAAKLRAERQAGAVSMDVMVGGIQTMATMMYREKMLDPLKPALVMPEVVDGSKWKLGKLWFSDPDQTYVLRLFNTLGTPLHINTNGVKLGELRSARDLLDPKWRGKIAVQDPTTPGSGSNHAAVLYVQFGEEFVKQLYVDQKPGISRDTRQVTDWLARGTYPIALGAEDSQVDQLHNEGLPIVPLDTLTDLPGVTSAGFGQVALINGAPHPNAARVFANWLASKEGTEIFARAKSAAPLRNDIDESFLPPEIIPRPGVKYFDGYDWEFTVDTKEKVRRRIKELMQGQ
jgi:iron(III) transport system substrate-binding protein